MSVAVGGHKHVPSTCARVWRAPTNAGLTAAGLNPARRSPLMQAAKARNAQPTRAQGCRMHLLAARRFPHPPARAALPLRTSPHAQPRLEQRHELGVALQQAGQPGRVSQQRLRGGAGAGAAGSHIFVWRRRAPLSVLRQRLERRAGEPPADARPHRATSLRPARGGLRQPTAMAWGSCRIPAISGSCTAAPAAAAAPCCRGPAPPEPCRPKDAARSACGSGPLSRRMAPAPLPCRATAPPPPAGWARPDPAGTRSA